MTSQILPSSIKPERLSAEQIVERLARPLNVPELHGETSSFLYNYYHEIAPILARETESFSFENLVERPSSAFAKMSDGNGRRVISFPRRCNRRFFCLNLLHCLQVLYVQSEGSQDQINQLFLRALTAGPKDDAELMLRPALKRYLSDPSYHRTLSITNELTTGLMAFAICREIAHHFLKRVEEPCAVTKELNVDQLAFVWLIRISNCQDQLTHLKISNNALCAPILSFQYFELADQLGFVGDNTINTLPDTHRSARLIGRFDRVAGYEAKNLYKSLDAGLGAIKVALRSRSATHNMV